MLLGAPGITTNNSNKKLLELLVTACQKSQIQETGTSVLLFLSLLALRLDLSGLLQEHIVHFDLRLSWRVAVISWLVLD